jgi:hypothetical protein
MNQVHFPYHFASDTPSMQCSNVVISREPSAELHLPLLQSSYVNLEPSLSSRLFSTTLAYRAKILEMSTQAVNNLDNGSKLALCTFIPGFREDISIDNLDIRCGLSSLVDVYEKLGVIMPPVTNLMKREFGNNVIEVSDSVVRSKSRCLRLDKVGDVSCPEMRLAICVLIDVSGAR